jgi:hypothetical protein
MRSRQQRGAAGGQRWRAQQTGAARYHGRECNTAGRLEGGRRVVVTGGAPPTKQVADSAASAREGWGWHDAMLQGIAC